VQGPIRAKGGKGTRQPSFNSCAKIWDDVEVATALKCTELAELIGRRPRN